MIRARLLTIRLPWRSTRMARTTSQWTFTITIWTKISSIKKKMQESKDVHGGNHHLFPRSLVLNQRINLLKAIFRVRIIQWGTWKVMEEKPIRKKVKLQIASIKCSWKVCWLQGMKTMETSSKSHLKTSQRYHLMRKLSMQRMTLPFCTLKTTEMRTPTVLSQLLSYSISFRLSWVVSNSSSKTAQGLSTILQPSFQTKA